MSTKTISPATQRKIDRLTPGIARTDVAIDQAAIRDSGWPTYRATLIAARLSNAGLLSAARLGAPVSSEAASRELDARKFFTRRRD